MDRLLIVHSSEIYATSLARRLSGSYDVRICTDGTLACEQIGIFQPDILILHTALPRKDALSILREMPHTPDLILATTNFLNDKQERRLLALGVQQIMLMPTVSSLVLCLDALIEDLRCHGNRRSAEQLTAMHLHILNFKPNLDGYQQLYLGLPMLVADPRQVLSKQLYPAIAQAMDVSDGRAVEHSIRKAIFNAWQVRDDMVWSKYFPPEANGKSPCPSNKLFLLRLVELIRQET